MRKYRGEVKDKNLSVKKYLNRIKPYLSDIKDNYKTQGTWRIHSGNTIIERKTHSEWKIQLTMKIYFISSKKDSNETRIIHGKNDNIEIIMSSETDEIIKDLFTSLSQRYQEGLEESMRRSNYIFDSVNALYYDLNKKV